ncbi:Anaphase-promoting complex subunit 1 [Lignoscripta atroalba]|nr:Anaphase-promoting complex subunit 1 [Lignoscripta atroalba]
MASVTSLGIHKPSALPSLVAEGTLPPEQSETSYSWQTICGNTSAGYKVEEEILTTKSCVVWSRGGVVRRIFRFEVENEPVVQALLTRFSTGYQRSSTRAKAELPATTQGEQGVGARKQNANPARSDTTEHHGQSRSPPHSQPEALSQSSGQVNEGGRALVVILRTQAHVYFLSGTSHIVHLPFEIDAAFPLIQGILLQRKIEKKTELQSTPRLPSVPANSFAFSHQGSSWGMSSPQVLQDVVSSHRAASVIQPLVPSVINLSSLSKRPVEAELPRNFCLTDPLSEIGIVLAGPGQRVKRTQGITSTVYRNLDAAETLIYVSSQDELEHLRVDLPLSASLTLALTMNRDTGMYNLWAVTYVEPDPRSTSRSRYASTASGTMSRRRSSYGPGVATGATTPIVRNPVSVRQSFGDPAQSFAGSSVVQNEVDLAAQLDTAFEHPGAPAKSSRRVSSLLARADLSTSHDRSTFSDLVGGYDAFGTTRRGPSFGTYATRLSAGQSNESHHPSRRIANGLQDSQSFMNLPADETLDEDGSADDMSTSSDLESSGKTRGLRTEMMFNLIHPITNNFKTLPTNQASETKPEVFTLISPVSKFSNLEYDTEIVICMIDRERRSLLVLQILVHISSSNLARKEKYAVQPGVSAYKYRVVNVRHGNGVIDACKVSDGDCCRILVLSESADGFGELTMQAPWGTLKKVQLPTPLSIYNPFQVVQGGVSLACKRDGGFKRVLSQGPQALAALQHSAGTNVVDVLDQERVRHRIMIKMMPNNGLVRQAIRVCESIVPMWDTEREPMLRGWWEVSSWLRDRGVGDQLEWTAFVVLLFSMAVGFLDDRQTQGTLRHKRRKGQLPRSSSGATIDLESWDTMLAEESNNCASSPLWMQDAAWEWTLEQNDIDIAHDESEIHLSTNSRSSAPTTVQTPPMVQKSSFLIKCMSLARDFVKSPSGPLALGERGFLPTAASKDAESRRIVLPTILVGMHLFREELKLDVLAADRVHALTPVLAQIGGWLNWESWSWRENAFYMLENARMDQWLFEDSKALHSNSPRQLLEPPSILSYIEDINLRTRNAKFLTLLDLVSPAQSTAMHHHTLRKVLEGLTPRTKLILDLLNSKDRTPADHVVDMAAYHLKIPTLESLPEGVAASLREAISVSQANPSSIWGSPVLAIVDRADISMLERKDHIIKPQTRSFLTAHHEALRDVHSICLSTLEVETVGAYDGSAEVDRHSITRMVFRDDQRFAEATKLMHPLKPAIARCRPEPDWSDTDLLEAQQEMVKIIAVRTLSVSPGRAMLFYSARLPLLTEKFPIHGFTLSCVMKPANTTVTADRNVYTEEKVSWAFFHAGVEAGLSISRGAKGIDTSWILFNKPVELSNRHAGFLLALGLNGHLKSIAKWVAFKYLTPKHTMTSIGLLLGLSASYLGTMDTLITRLLSVHVTRMLPPGAAELNLSPLTQTTGIMGIGLLYCNTQHRRMSEIMLSEMENVDQDDTSSPMDNLRDEGYRLAAGFALGYINLGKGKDLKGLHDMHIIERLLALAVGTRKVDIVHILDKATAAATIAITLIFMKTQDEALARRIDIPDTIHQFDYVRPDIFLLRTVARHLIMWDNISPTTAWIRKQLPSVHQPRAKLTGIRFLATEDMPLFNIIAGLCFSVGLRYAGTGRQDVRNLLGHYLDQFIRISRLPALNYDGKLTRITTRNCQDAVALAAASVMAGTGDLYVFRRLRSLHGRTDPDTPYGSHLAAHLAIGVLFLGGGTYTFSTSNIAVASLLCAFYPLFPTTVLDNKSHLQAFRHFWVLAAEPRCLIARDVDTQRPISVPILITLRTGEELAMTAPCLLPELDTVASVQTNDPEYWRVTLDFANNPSHLPAFKRHQSIFVRRRAAYDAHSSVFSATLQALNDAQSAHQLSKQVFDWIFELPTFQIFDRAERALVLTPDASSAMYKGMRGTVVDDRLMLEKGCIGSGRAERLWNLRVLFAWAERARREGRKLEWLRREVVEGLRAAVSLEGRDEEIE